MKIDNLKTIGHFIKFIPKELFDCRYYRTTNESLTKRGFILDNSNPICHTIGNIIGHSTFIDSENIKNNFIDSEGIIMFQEWGEFYTGIKFDSNEWNWLFASTWWWNDNTPYGASKKIEHFLKNGLPEDWEIYMKEYHSVLPYIGEFCRYYDVSTERNK